MAVISAVIKASADVSEMKNKLAEAGSAVMGFKDKIASAAASLNGSGGFSEAAEHVAKGIAGIGVAIGGVALAAITGIATAIVELGERGSGVNDVRESFDRLNATMGRDGPTALAALRKGSAGLISDYDLMKPLNAALSAGFQMNAADAYTMSRAAWALADANDKGVKESYDSIAEALTSGKAKALSMMGVQVEQKGASLDLKAALNAEGQEMLTSADLASKRQAIMEGLNRIVLDAGDKELDFAEKIQRAKVGMQNMTDSVSAAIASSPVLGVVMDKIGDALQSAFGANQTKTVQTLIGYVNQFAIFLVNVAQAAVTGAEYIVGAYRGVQIIFDGLMTVIFTVAAGVNDAFASIAEGATHLPGVGDKFRGIAAAMREEATQTEGMRDSFAQQTKEAIANGGAQMEAFEGTKAMLGKLADQMEAAGKQGVSNAEIAKNLTVATGAVGKAHNDAAKDIEANRKKLAELNTAITMAKANGVDHTTILQRFGAEAEKAGLDGQIFGNKVTVAVKQIGDEFKDADISKNVQEIAKVWADANDKMAKSTTAMLDKWTNETNAAARKVADAHAAALADQIVAAAEYQEKNYQLTLHGSDLQVRQLQLAHDAEIAALKKKFDDEGPLYQNAKAQIDAFFEHQIHAAIEADNSWAKSLGDVGQAFGVLDKLASGDLANILQSLSDVTSAIQNVIKTQHEMDDQQAPSGGSTAATVGKIAAYATVYGAVAMAAISAGKAIYKAMNDGRQAVDGFAASMGGFDALHAKLLALGDAGEQMWIKLTQGVGRGDQNAAKAAIDEITAALAGQDAYMQRLPGLIDKYGLSWADAGQQAKQAHLDEIAQGLIQDFADLSRAGFDVTVITTKMGDAIDDYVHQAMATGTEIPAAMKPLLQKMIDMGTLTDDAGNKLTDLGELTFAETLTEGFKSIVDAINQLTKALGGIPTRIDTDYYLHTHGTPPGDGDPGDGGGVPGAATGAYVGKTNIIPFRLGGPVFQPMGTDTVAAMLTPGEIVLNAAQQGRVAGAITGGGSTSALERKMDEVIAALRQLPEAVGGGDTQVFIGNERIQAIVKKTGQRQLNRGTWRVGTRTVRSRTS